MTTSGISSKSQETDEELKSMLTEELQVINWVIEDMLSVQSSKGGQDPV